LKCRSCSYRAIWDWIAVGQYKKLIVRPCHNVCGNAPNVNGAIRPIIRVLLILLVLVVATQADPYNMANKGRPPLEPRIALLEQQISQLAAQIQQGRQEVMALNEALQRRITLLEVPGHTASYKPQFTHWPNPGQR